MRPTVLGIILGACWAAALANAPAQALVGASVEADAASAAQSVMVLKRAHRTAGFCTGVVVARDVVLTAGHCADGAQELAINAAAPGRPPRLIGVRDVAMHPEFRKDAARRRVRSVDMALLRLREPLPASFAPARLDSVGGVRVGERYRIVGFGLTREGDERSAGKLRAGELEARAPLSKILLWAKSAGAKGFGACTGDSGGPIFGGGGELVAITSWSTGPGKKTCGNVTQAALIAPQRDWIARVLAGWR